MATQVAFELTANGSQAEGSVKSLKAQLREAQNDVQALSEKFGATSQAAIDAARKAASLKDAIGDAKALTDAYNPDAKFKAFGAALQGVVGGLAALQGAQALLGSESEDLQKALVKVQGAMALSQGLNSVLEAKDSFKNLGTLIKGNVTKAFGTLKGAIASTGIGLLVVGLGLLIANFDKVKKVVLNLIPGLGAVADFIGGLVNKITDFVGVTSAAGRATEKLIKDNEKAIKDTERFLDLNADKYDQYTQKKIKANLDFKKKQNEFLADETLSEAQKNKFIAEARDKANREIAASEKERTDKSNEERQKENDKIKADNDKKGQLAKQNSDKQKAFDKELRDAKNKTYLDGIKDEDLKAKEELRLKFESQKLDLEQSDKTAAQKTALKLEYEKQYVLELAKLEQEQADKAEQKRQEDKEKKDKQTEEDLEEEKNRQEKFNQLRQEGLQNALKIEEDFANAKQGIRDAELNAVSTGISILGQLGEKNKAIQKVALIAENAVAIARTVIAANQSILETRAKANAIPAFIGPGIPNPSYIAAQLLATKNILSTKINAATSIASIVAATAKGLGALGGGSGGGGGTVGGGGGGTQSNAPLTPQVQTTNLNQGQINQLASATSRAFVLESDVSGSQERIQRLNRAARIN
jgi:hypothetical protein